jgi:hypothetical protein
MDKLEARKEMLKMLKGKMKQKSREDFKSILPKKPMQVTVGASSPEGLKEGLEMAEELMENGEEESCPKCEGKGCEACGSVDKEAIKKKILG